MNATLKGYIKPSPKTLPTPSTLHPETPGRVLGFKGLGFRVFFIAWTWWIQIGLQGPDKSCRFGVEI